jgi:hypothetical protein
MIEHLMSSSLSGDHQGCAAGFIRLHVWGLRSYCRSYELSCCATGAVHTEANLSCGRISAGFRWWSGLTKRWRA